MLAQFEKLDTKAVGLFTRVAWLSALLLLISWMSAGMERPP
jgi:uncharacterized membrane protein affecting hemolysin expression